jgi:putative ABC transport system permease protein
MSFLQDIRLALRLYWRNPTFTLIALLSISLSVAATAVVFTAIHAVLIKPLPYAHPENLVQIRAEFGSMDPSPSGADWVLGNDAREIARRTNTLASVGIYRNALLDLAGDATTPPESIYGLRMSANVLTMLGVTPMLGRDFLPDEDRPNVERVMILSYGLWKRRFNLDRTVIGRTVRIDGENCRVIGVMAPDFNFPLRRQAAHTPVAYVEFWTPMRASDSDLASVTVGLVARLNPGATLAQAQHDLASINDSLVHDFPATNRDHTLRVGLLRDRTAGNAKAALWFLMASALMFLLIGCANVANLLLARGVVRQREIAIRIAIGAGPARIVRQLLTETCVLAIFGGLGGYLQTVFAWKILPAIVPISIPRLAGARADWKILGFALVVAFINGMMFGIVPALRAGWTRVIASNQFGARGAAPGSGDRVRSSLIVAEVAIAVTLVIAGGQLLQNFLDLLRTDPGFQADHILASVIIPEFHRYSSPESHGVVYKRFLDSVRAIPGVESLGTVNALPFSGENDGGLIAASESSVNDPNHQTPAEIDAVSPEYLQTMGVRLSKGRWFREEDMSASSTAAIVSDVVEVRLWPGESAIGTRICVYCTLEKPDNWKQVVGVVSSVRHVTMEGPPPMSVYLSAAAFQKAQFLVVRTSRPNGEIEQAIRRAIAAVDPDQPVFLSVSMQTLISDSLADRRFIMTLLAIFGGLALAMSGAGVYGVTSYLTSRRTQEIGLRMALGASPGNVQFLIFRQGFMTTAIGLAIGVGMSWALMRTLRGVLSGLQFQTAAQMFVAVGIVAFFAAVASWIPARRAARLDPMSALRQE